jgi:signal transduction histidine kinase
MALLATSDPTGAQAVSQVPDEQHTLLSTRPPTGRQERRALAASLVMLALFLGALSFAHVELRRIDPIMPIIATVISLADAITSALLLAKFAVLRSPGLMVLAGGYLFAGLLRAVYALVLPGAVSESGLLGAGAHSSAWLFTAWHFGFPATVIAYALLKDSEPRRQMARGSVRAAVLASVTGVLGLVAGLTWLVTVHQDALPPVELNEVEVTPILDNPIAPALLLVCAAAVALLWVRRRSLLDLWLLLVAWAWLLESILLLVVDRRFTVDWYATRVLGIASATFVLVALLSEMTTIYARLALSVMARRREREGRLMTMDVVGASIAHEIKQPLKEIADSGEAGLRWLGRATPDVARATQALKDMVDDGHRAGQVIARVREIFRRDEPDKGDLDINDVVEDALALARGELRRHGIAVDAKLDAVVGRITANRAQLQQVLLNLIANAIEAMDKDAVWPRALRVHTESDGQDILVTVEDTGPGIDPSDSERIFDPLLTTKSGATGWGLPVCRSIVEAHGGRMWATPGVARGTALHFTLPVAGGDRPKWGAQLDRPPIARSVQARPADDPPALPSTRRTGTVSTDRSAERAAASRVPDEWPTLLSTRPPGRGQTRLALLAGLLLLGVFLATLPVAYIQLGHIAAYIPVTATAMSINDTITSALLFAQFSVLRTFALLVLAAGYLLTGLLLIVWMLVFPGGFSPTGLLGAGPQSAPWLYMVWHLGFPAIVIAYALLEDAEPARHVPYGAERMAILVSAVCVVCFVLGLAWLATVHHGILPELVQVDAEFRTVWFKSMVSGSTLLCVAAIAVLWTRSRSLLDVWLLVVMWAWLLKSALLLMIGYRYDVAWYANVAFALASATLVLLVLLSETTMMHARLVLSATVQRREQRGRLMTMDAVASSIAHEINQPLAAIVNNGSAALRWLARPTPDIRKASEALKAMLDDSRRASQVIDGIRGVLRRDQPEKENLDINAVIEEVLVLVRGELSSRGIALRADLDPGLPPLSANKVQLQQVLLNLIANASEALERAGSRTGGTLRVGTARRAGEALVTVEDDGVGVDPDDRDHIFDPFFTTKPHGTGLGLAICRSIVEAHGGRMWAAPGAPCGTVLYFTLPLARQG